MQLINDLVINKIRSNLYEGGTIAEGHIYGDTDLLQYGDNVRVMGKSFADSDDFADREILNGHVLQTPELSFDALSSRADVQIGTANYLMRGRLQDIGFTEQAVPANDHQIAPTMRISSCFNHITQSHCNFIYNATDTPDGIINSTDIDTSDTPLARFNVYEDNNFWNALINQLAGGEEGGVQFYRCFFRRDNQLVYQAAPLFLASPPASKGTLTKEHIRGTPRITIRNASAEDQVGQAQIVATTGANAVLSSSYPALQPTSGRIVNKDSNIWADTQARVDTLAQNLYEWLTRPYTLEVEVDPGLILFGDDGKGLDLADRLQVTYDGPTENALTYAGVHVNLSSQNFWVYGYEIDYDADSKMATGKLILEADN